MMAICRAPPRAITCSTELPHVIHVIERGGARWAGRHGPQEGGNAAGEAAVHGGHRILLCG